ncbi:MAG: amino acid adenylation domain-containing protein, partial [Acidobacteria bacterium]|nr:amino acid adenylation domain-containing protein [Acidobacteriota bacterium]
MTNDYFYRTGDLARWLPAGPPAGGDSGGVIEFLGRIDHQVKIRGFRIELREIESQLLKHPAVKEAVVICRDSGTGDKHLCAYVAGRETGHAEFRDYLSKTLPGYMIPSYFMRIDKIPLLSNGKVDKKMLSELALEKDIPYTPPGNKIENTLVEIWSGVLGIEKEKIGIDTPFFELGGHSLNAAMMVSRVHKVFEVAIPLVEIFKTQTIRRLAELIKHAEKNKFNDIEPVEKKEYYDLSYHQKRLWVIQQLNPGDTSYHMPGVFLLNHPVNIEAAKKSLLRISQKHESLRTFFKEKNGHPVQFIDTKVDIPLEVCDISTTENENKELYRKNIILNEQKTPFDLARLPLFRVKLVKLEKDLWYLIFTMHHIISDGWSQEILRKDFIYYYEFYNAGDEVLPGNLSLPVQYKDFAAWENRFIDDLQVKEKARQSWLNQCEKEFSSFQLPGDFAGNNSDPGASVYRLILKNEIKAQLHRLAAAHTTTLFIVLFSAFNWLLAHFSGRENILCSIISAGRQHIDLQNAVGYFINSLPVKTEVNPEETFNDFLQRMDKNTRELFQYQFYPLELILAELKMPYPEVPVSFNMLNIQENSQVMELENFETGHSEDLDPGAAKFDLALYITEYKKCIVINWNYKRSLFKPQTIEILANGYLELLNAIISHINNENEPVKMKDIPIFDLPSRRMNKNTVQPVNDFSEFKKKDIEQSIGQRFAQQAYVYPDKVAIKVKSLHLTYDSLKHRIDQTAHTILQKTGPCETGLQRLDTGNETGNPGKFKIKTTALLLGHDTNMVIGLMGALTAGKAYVPLVPDYPRERLEFILEDSNSQAIITDDSRYELAVHLGIRVGRDINIINIDKIKQNEKARYEKPGITVHPKDPAYILYTSGSTGQPKGVIQDHRDVLHFARVYANALHLTSNDRFTLFSSYSFDAAKMDIFGAILNGGTLFPYDIKYKDNLCRLPQWLQAEKITIFHSIPTVYRYFTNELTGSGNFSNLRLIVLGGEPVFKKDVETYKTYFPDHCLFINGLGPTESTVTLQYFIDKNTEITREAVPVGYPVDETEVFLIDDNGRETQGYGIGEIVYKSNYLALGYLNNCEKTAEVFVKNPLKGKDRVYRSGDLGQRMWDGSIIYMGRKDSQVKIRGFRIELQEIEGKLDTMPGIKKSAVIFTRDEKSEGYLIAYYILKDSGQPFDNINLTNNLRKLLPDYMMPQAFYPLNEFPYTVTGKIDRRALAELASTQKQSPDEFVAPADGIEMELAEIWQNILGIEKVGIKDDFFKLGG